MSKKSFRVVALMVIAILALGALPVTAQDKAVVNWFVGLGTGTNPEQIEAQEQVVADFNAAHPDIELVLNIAASNTASIDALSTLIAAGTAPDIVGPVGTAGANSFAGSWLDLQPLVDSTGYDLTQFPEAAVNFYREPDGLLGLPLATFPSFLFFNRDLFDEAGLNYPPQEFGAPYVDAEGNEVEWNWEALADVAALLTVDSGGNDATSPDFDPENIVQFGYFEQWPNMRNEFSAFGAGQVWDPETGEADIPENWRAFASWYYDAIWTKHISPNSAYESSELLQGGGGAFSSGNVGMARTHLWYTCCLGDMQSWDIAFLPTYNGTYTATLHADTFRVMATTQNPEATFTALTYLTGEASLSLLGVYGGMPAREGDRDAFFAGLDETYPQGVNWNVARESLNYPDVPSHEAWFPNYNKGEDRFRAFQSLYHSTADLDLTAELDSLEADLQAIIDEVS
jgi:multiple sugar transport system substrate-binding protein